MISPCCLWYFVAKVTLCYNKIRSTIDQSTASLQSCSIMLLIFIQLMAVLSFRGNSINPMFIINNSNYHYCLNHESKTQQLNSKWGFCFKNIYSIFPLSLNLSGIKIKTSEQNEGLNVYFLWSWMCATIDLWYQSKHCASTWHPRDASKMVTSSYIIECNGGIFNNFLDFAM